MALEQKNGGPYSKDEREKRQNEVFRLHFEFGYSAVKIAELMKINRNTINADIKYWYSNIKDELKQDSEDLILRQMGRLEAQRTRIIENITEKKIDDIRYEKMLLEIDGKINNMLLRINPVKVTSEINEDLIKDIILFLIVKHRNHDLKKENILSETINMQQCTTMQAQVIFSQIENLGLECCRKFRSGEFVYDLLEFAYLRRYVLTGDEFIVKVHALYILEIHNKEERLRLGKKYAEKYGSKERWADEIFAEYDEDKNKIMQKYAETSSTIVAEALENLSNYERGNEYIKYINVFFGKEQMNRFEEYLE